ncbi:sodium/proline symporter [Pyruvatibacter sp.]|uniref:sodium/proline symporter n=1 Tax=Pyruvatibacter sp. TaxID=1981328 RepID=UPI0032EEF993
MILISFLTVLGAFLAIGLASIRQATGEREDYYLAGRSVRPWLVGLSAVATNNSGYMFIGVIGYTYEVGLAAIWLMIGWILGDFLGSTFVHRRLRQATAATKEASYVSVLARWYGDGFATWQRIGAVIVVLFLIAYAAAQIAAGGKALQGVLGFDPRLGAIAVALVVVAYSIAGGIRASIWTDAAQSFVMLAAMTLMLVVGVQGLGGWQGTIEQWQAVPRFLDLFPDDLILAGAAGMGLFVLGWMFAGFSVVGQPHVMVRFMALEREDQMVKARVWYYSYFIMFYLLATGVGMLSRIYLPDLASIDPELALPRMAVELLPPVLVGLVLAGIFAATMSTADSLVLSCSAAITHDLAPNRLESPVLLKTATAVVTLAALGLALLESQSVFNLVILSWSTLACAFAPLLVLYALGRRVTETTAVALMVAGVAIALTWRFGFGFHTSIYEGLPGILIPLIAGWIFSQPFAANDESPKDHPAESRAL